MTQTLTIMLLPLLPGAPSKRRRSRAHALCVFAEVHVHSVTPQVRTTITRRQIDVARCPPRCAPRTRAAQARPAVPPTGWRGAAPRERRRPGRGAGGCAANDRRCAWPSATPTWASAAPSGSSWTPPRHWPRGATTWWCVTRPAKPAQPGTARQAQAGRGSGGAAAAAAFALLPRRRARGADRGGLSHAPCRHVGSMACASRSDRASVCA